MRKFLEVLLGVPVTKQRVRSEVETFAKARDVHAMRAVMNENLAHLTGKSGALLQAQGIFVVVATYALDQGWPRYLTLSSVLLLIVSALAVMTNLRSVFIGLDANADRERAEIENLVRTAEIASWRGALFNLALYLTFLSILLLGIGAVVLEVHGRAAS
jgi:hypothetical protein